MIEVSTKLSHRNKLNIPTFVCVHVKRVQSIRKFDSFRYELNIVVQTCCGISVSDFLKVSSLHSFFLPFANFGFRTDSI
jgi:hypothetical protein